MLHWEQQFEPFILQPEAVDPVHDLAHIRRVVTTAKQLCEQEGADPQVVIPAAWLHDCVPIAKTSPDRKRASQLAADAAGAFLDEIGYPAHHIPAIQHAIVTHSFTANITPETIEAKVVQDADRLDALGAVGIARCLMLAGHWGNALYDVEEPFPVTRRADDKTYAIDHFFTKLLHLEGTMQTDAGRAEAAVRTTFLKAYLYQLEREIG